MAVGVAEGVGLGVAVGVGVEDGVCVGECVGVHVGDGVAVGEAGVKVEEGIGVSVPGTAPVAGNPPGEGRATTAGAQALSASTTKTADKNRLFERTETLSPPRERHAGLVREIPRRVRQYQCPGYSRGCKKNSRGRKFCQSHAGGNNPEGRSRPRVNYHKRPNGLVYSVAHLADDCQKKRLTNTRMNCTMALRSDCMADS